MNSDPNHLRTLLEDVLPPSASCGPDRAAVLKMVRRERALRRCRRAVLSAGCAVLALALLAFWPAPSSSPQAPVAVAALPSPPRAPSIVIHEVNDQQLLALLQDTPVALMEWPNGERALMVIEQ